MPSAAPKNGLPPNRFALNPINIGNSVNGAFAKMLIISANPQTDYEHLLKIYYHKRDLVQLKYY